MTRRMTDRPLGFPWGLTVLTALLFCLLAALGAWQVQRLQWKGDLIARAEQASVAAPAAPGEVFSSPDPEFRKVALSCAGLASAPFIELQSIHEGQPGVRLISACSIGGSGPTLLVDRGFVPDVVSARPPVAASDEPVDVVAEVRATPRPGRLAVPPQAGRFYARDNPAMAEALGVQGKVSSWTLFALNSSNPDWAALQPSAPPAAFTNNHLGYAITWFGLALVLLGFYVALLRRRRPGIPVSSHRPPKKKDRP